MTPESGRNPGVPDSLIQQRISYAVTLKQSGLTQLKVLNRINSLAAEKGWGEISLRQLKRDFSNYWSRVSLMSDEETDYANCMKNMHLEGMEIQIAELSEVIEKTTEWQPFEKPRMIKLLFDMQYKYATLRGWNYSVQKTNYRSPNNQSQHLEDPNHITNLLRKADIAQENMTPEEREKNKQAIREVGALFRAEVLSEDGTRVLEFHEKLKAASEAISSRLKEL